MENTAFKLDGIRAVQRPISLSQNSVQLGEAVSLMRGRVHEVMGLAADSFTASLIGYTTGPVVWIGRGRDVHSVCPLAAARYFDPNRLVTTECISRKEILWASEQALRSKGVDCVITHVSRGPNLRESRRLQLAAEQGGSLGLVVIEKTAQSSAAQTRWQCEPVKRSEQAANDSGWVWRLTKNKSGPLGQWHVRWKGPKGGAKRMRDGYAAGYVDMVCAATV